MVKWETYTIIDRIIRNGSGYNNMFIKFHLSDQVEYKDGSKASHIEFNYPYTSLFDGWDKSVEIMIDIDKTRERSSNGNFFFHDLVAFKKDTLLLLAQSVLQEEMNELNKLRERCNKLEKKSKELLEYKLNDFFAEYDLEEKNREVSRLRKAQEMLTMLEQNNTSSDLKVLAAARESLEEAQEDLKDMINNRKVNDDEEVIKISSKEVKELSEIFSELCKISQQEQRASVEVPTNFRS